jgi:membrane associated rhomboid family serine protease
MRRPAFAPGRSATVMLLVANVAAFLVQFALSDNFVNNNLALSVPGLRQGYLWQLLTFQFMHAGILHLVLNCWAIFVFGREVEDAVANPWSAVGDHNHY